MLTTTTSRPIDALTPESSNGVAGALAVLLRPVFRGDLPIRLRAWDGSQAGPDDAPVVTIGSVQGLRRLLRHPGELGLAQAYVTGDLDVEGDLRTALGLVWRTVRDRGVTGGPGRGASGLGLPAIGVAGFGAWGNAARTAYRLGALGPPPPPPMAQARMRGRLHSMLRDRQAICHHYDLSNDFYQLILDPQLAYSCAYWTGPEGDMTLPNAQRAKLDLVCDKLGLKPGMRLLDLGCGWGALSLHAAEHYGAQVVGVTLSAAQRDYARAQIAQCGLDDLVEVRLQHYREVSDGPFDAVSSIEMGEHVGAHGYPAFLAQIHDLLRPEGRLLIQQMSRRSRPGGGPFIEAFIAPDMHMRPVGQTVELVERAGLEVRDVHALREHYVRTIDEWYRTLERRWDEAVDLVGAEVARVWRLYLAGSALSFQEARMGVDQILAVRTTTDGSSGMPLERRT